MRNETTAPRKKYKSEWAGATSVWLNTELKCSLDQYAEDESINRSKLIKKLLREHLKKKGYWRGD